MNEPHHNHVAGAQKDGVATTIDTAIVPVVGAQGAIGGANPVATGDKAVAAVLTEEKKIEHKADVIADKVDDVVAGEKKIEKTTAALAHEMHNVEVGEKKLEVKADTIAQEVKKVEIGENTIIKMLGDVNAHLTAVEAKVDTLTNNTQTSTNTPVATALPEQNNTTVNHFVCAPAAANHVQAAPLSGSPQQQMLVTATSPSLDGPSAGPTLAA